MEKLIFYSVEYIGFFPSCPCTNAYFLRNYLEIWWLWHSQILNLYLWKNSYLTHSLISDCKRDWKWIFFFESSNCKKSWSLHFQLFSRSQHMGTRFSKQKICQSRDHVFWEVWTHLNRKILGCRDPRYKHENQINSKRCLECQEKL